MSSRAALLVSIVAAIVEPSIRWRGAESVNRRLETIKICFLMWRER